MAFGPIELLLASLARSLVLNVLLLVIVAFRSGRRERQQPVIVCGSISTEVFHTAKCRYVKRSTRHTTLRKCTACGE